MSESFEEMLARKALATVQENLPALVESAMTQAQNIGFQRVQEIVRRIDLIPPAAQEQIVDVLEQAKVETPAPTVHVEAAPGTPKKQDAAIRGWRTFIQSLLGILVVAFGDEFLKAFDPSSGFDLYSLASWQNLLAAGASAAVAAGIAFLMRYWTPRGT